MKFVGVGISLPQILDDGPTDVQAPFYWQDRFGELHAVNEMETGYLFNCLKMMWNHTVPSHMRLRPYKHWTLNGERFHDRGWKEYAVRSMWNELVKRDDLTEFMKSTLFRMHTMAVGYLQREG
jgi:hypothetical protein